MLLIFDLDDTLVQTSETLTPYLLENALRAMRLKGLFVPDLIKAIEEIKQLDRQTQSSRETLSLFLKRNGNQHQFFDIGIREIRENTSFTPSFLEMEKAQEILENLRLTHTLSLVSVGNWERQYAKMEKAGIDSTVFSKIIICNEGQKGPHYQEIVDSFGFTPKAVLVCGDRIESDLAPAKALGYHTVRLCRGRGANDIEDPTKVDTTIYRLEELKAVIDRLSKIS